MLASKALAHLSEELAKALRAFSIETAVCGHPKLVQESAEACNRLFQGQSISRSHGNEAYAAAKALIQGQELTEWQREIVASVLSTPIKELSGAQALASRALPQLLNFYQQEAERGGLWRLTWHGLLTSYFAYEPAADGEQRGLAGWLELRKLLEKTWSYIDRESGRALVPDWITILRNEPELLSASPAEKYAKAYLSGDTERVDRISADLGISSASWFWSALVLAAVKEACSGNDTNFVEMVSRLIKLIEVRPTVRDKALQQILERYHRCTNTGPHEGLRDYVVQPSVWKNPKLHAAGIATAWNQVPEPVWRMVLSWVNERNLKDFFDILAARNSADEGRLAFWSKYLKQITWTRLVFSAETMALKSYNPAIRDLIAHEQGTYAELTENRGVDAFMMKIGNYIIVEFSKQPNASYGYRAEAIKFDINRRTYRGTTDDLKYGYYDRSALRITHQPGWESDAKSQLRRLGIEPDR